MTVQTETWSGHGTTPSQSSEYPHMESAKKRHWVTKNPQLLLPSVQINPPKPVGIFCDADQRDAGQPVALGATLTLDEAETENCIFIGRERNRKNLEKKTTNMNYSNRDDNEISIQGVLGEFAFCKMFGLPIEIFDTTCRNSWTEERFDAVLPNGWTVDVKTTIYDNADIRVTPWKANNAPSLYALMILCNYDRDTPITVERPPVLSYRGMVASREVFQDCYLQAVSRMGSIKQYYCVPQKVLKTLEQVRESDGQPSRFHQNNHRANMLAPR